MNSPQYMQVKVLSLTSDHFRDRNFVVSLSIGHKITKQEFSGTSKQIAGKIQQFPQASGSLEVQIYERQSDAKKGYFSLELKKLWEHPNRNHAISLTCKWVNLKKQIVQQEEDSATARISIIFPNKPFSRPEQSSKAVSLNAYDIAFQRAADPFTREDFWKEQASFLEWFKFPETILDETKAPFYKWFPDGEINIIHNMIDRYLPKYANKTSLIWVSNMVNQQKVWTLQQVYQNVCKMALLMKKNGVEKGDRVIIYFPMIPEALFATWACARIGAIHSIVFGGFAAKELGSRITDATPKAIVTTSCGLEPNKKINYAEILSQAIALSGQNPAVLIYQRPGLQVECDKSWTQFNIKNLQFKHVQCEKMKSTDMLYILYTSGTTGQPKGIVRDQGGTAVALEWMMKHTLDIHLGDVYFAASDIGWVVGHNYTVYGPLLRGAATVLYEGKPMLPNPGVLWAIVEKYRVKGLYTSPTGLRAIRKEDSNGEWVKKFDTSSLNALTMAGERCDIPTYEWIRDRLRVLINDNYWQTECGWGIACNYKNLHTFPEKPGSATKPCPGFVVEILNHENQKVSHKTLGKVCVRLPMPPSFMLTLYNNDKAFIQKYLQETPGYYTAGDAGYFDQDGYLNVMTRLDDIINTAGHRLSTASMQQNLMTHPKVSQAAVVAKLQELKGQIPIGFVVLKTGADGQGIQKQLIAVIRKSIGPVAAFQHVLVVDKLPKTRSGKILRHILRKMIEGESYKYPPTIQDDTVLKKIEAQVKAYGNGLGDRSKLVYRGDVDATMGNMQELEMGIQDEN